MKSFSELEEIFDWGFRDGSVPQNTGVEGRPVGVEEAESTSS